MINPKAMQMIGRYYVQYFNKTYQRTGTLWEGRYKATLIDNEAYALTCYRYIEWVHATATATRLPRIVQHPAGHKALDEIREATNKSWVLDSEYFKEKIAAELDRPVAPSAKGGDRKSKQYQAMKTNRV